MRCKDPNDYTEPERPIDVSAQPEWPEIHKIDYGWACRPVYTGPNQERSGCCVKVQGGNYATKEECEASDENDCEGCFEEPVKVVDNSYNEEIELHVPTEYLAVGEEAGTTIDPALIDEGGNRRILVSSVHVYTPVMFYYKGSHFYTGETICGDDSKSRHVYLESMILDEATGKPIDYEYRAKVHYMPITIYKQTKAYWRYYDGNNFKNWGAGDGLNDPEPENLPGLKAGQSSILDRLESHKEEYGWPTLGGKSVYLQYDPMATAYFNHEPLFTYAQWAEFNNDGDFVFPVCGDGLYSFDNVELLRDLLNAWNTEPGIRSQITDFLPDFEKAVEWDNYVTNWIDPPGWVEGGFPTFFKTSWTNIWKGRFDYVPSKIINRYFGSGANPSFLNFNSTNAHFLRDGRNWGENRMGGIGRQNESTQAYPNKYYDFRLEIGSDRAFMTDDGLRFVKEPVDPDTGDPTGGEIEYTDVIYNWKGISTFRHPEKMYTLIDGIFDNVYVSGQAENSLWGSHTPSCTPYGSYIAINGTYPLFESYDCAYKAAESGRVIQRRFVYSSDIGGVSSDTYYLYQPEDPYGSIGEYRYDGDFEGGNGDYWYGTNMTIEEYHLMRTGEDLDIPSNGPKGVGLLVEEAGGY